MTRRNFVRSVSLAAAALGTACNSLFAIQLLPLWRSLGWESETEWEGSTDVWRVDSVKIVWGLLFAYYAVSTVACSVGFLGIVRNTPSLVRFYRDYSFAEFVFTTASTLFLSYTVFTTPYVRTTVCEQLSRHPELLQNLTQMGLNLENCELWFDRAVIASLGVMFIVIVIRLHVMLALSKYYHYLARDRFGFAKPHGLRLITDGAQRIYLLPTPTTPTGAAPPSYNFNSPTARSHKEDIVVFAPVPVGGMSEQEALNMHATEAWIPGRGESGSNAPRSHRHSHSHSHSHRHHGSRTGSIRLEGGRSSLGDYKSSSPV